MTHYGMYIATVPQFTTLARPLTGSRALATIIVSANNCCPLGGLEEAYLPDIFLGFTYGTMEQQRRKAGYCFGLILAKPYAYFANVQISKNIVHTLPVGYSPI